MPRAPHRFAARRLTLWLPLLILIAGAAGSAALALQWQKTIAGRERTEFDGAVRESTAAIGSEFQRTEDALRGIRGLFASSDHVKASEFHAYVRSLDTAQRFPSIRAIAYTSAVPTRSLAQFVAAQRRDGE